MNRSPLRVLMVSPRYLPSMGGVENHVYQVSRRLVQAGIDVSVLTTDPTGQWPEKEAGEGIQVRRVRAYPAQRDYFFAPALPNVIRQGKWDIVHVQSYNTLVAPMAMYAAWRAHIPYVVTFHGGGHSSRLRNAVRGLQWRMLRPLLLRAARLISTARFEIKLFAQALSLPLDRFTLIPNGGDILGCAPDAAALLDPSLIISPGRLERYKGHHKVIAAMPHVLKKRPDMRLLVLGAGPFEPELAKLSKRLGIAERVEIRGLPMTERDSMIKTLSQAALVVMMSEYETPSIAALEAITLKRSVLVANSTGLAELAEQGLARAVSLHCSPEQLAAAILDQLQYPHLPATIALPTWDDCANQLYDVYQQVAPAHSSIQRMGQPLAPSAFS